MDQLLTIYRAVTFFNQLTSRSRVTVDNSSNLLRPQASLRLQKKASLAIFDRLKRSSRVTGDYHAAKMHRLDRNDTKMLISRGVEQNVSILQ